MSSYSYNLFILFQFKTKMQIQIMRARSGEPIQYKSTFGAARMIFKDHGVRGVFQGLSGTLLRDIPAYGIFFSQLSPLSSTLAFEIDNILLL